MKIFPRLTAVAILVALPLLAVATTSADTNAQLYLSPASQTVTQGATISFNLNLNSGGNDIFAWQTVINYPSNFTNVSVSTASGSPFTSDPGGGSVSGNAIKIARYFTSSSAYSGPVATITMTASGAGSASINLEHICASTSESASISCSAVTNGNGDILLGSIAGSTFSINASGGSGGGSGSTSNPGGSTAKPSGTTKTSAKAPGGNSTATTPAPAPTGGTPVTDTPTDATATTTTESKPATVSLTILDQDGKPIAGASVSIGGVTGKTDKNGKVTLDKLPAGTASGIVTYKGQRQAISLDVQDGSDQPKQSSQLTIRIKKTNSTAPIVITVSTLIIVAIGAFTLIGPGKGLLKLVGKGKNSVLPQAPAAKPAATRNLPPASAVIQPAAALHAIPSTPAVHEMKPLEPQAPVAAPAPVVEAKPPVEVPAPQPVQPAPTPETVIPQPAPVAPVPAAPAPEPAKPAPSPPQPAPAPPAANIKPLVPGTMFAPDDTPQRAVLASLPTGRPQ
jgi:hypothetical protein